MKKQLFYLILLFTFFPGIKSLSGQAINFYYETKAGNTDKDTVYVYGQSTSTSSVSINAVNFSFAFQSSCPGSYAVGSCAAVDTLVEMPYSWFSNNWGAFLERCEIKNTVSLSYNAISYNHRFSYANSSILSPWVVPASNSGSRMLIMTLLLNRSCTGAIYMEDETENPINQISDPTFTTVNYNVFTFGSAFPVDFVDFYAEKNEQQQVRLFWSTQKEVNSDYFQIQKSYSGKFDNPINLGTVTTMGESDEKISYEFWDNTPMLSKVYYRLKHIDRDGAHQYSPILSLSFDTEKFILFATTKHLDRELKISLYSFEDQPYNIRLINMQGQVLKEEQSWFGPGTKEELFWQVGNLPGGMYLLVSYNALHQEVKKVFLY